MNLKFLIQFFNTHSIKKIIIDICLNIIATSLPLIILQFIIQPYVAKKIGSDLYGSMLTMIGFLHIGMGVFGTSLNNTRLIDDNKYKKEKGDFNSFLAILVFIDVMTVWFVIDLYNFPKDPIALILFILSSMSSVISTYLVVEYRLSLSYKRILVSKVILTIGFSLGTYIFTITHIWQWIFFLGYGLELMYVLLTTHIWLEPFKFTQNVWKTLRRIVLLALSALIRTLLNYFDRLFIFPLFGGTALSVYYAATIVGKTMGLLVGPLSNVLISYSVHIKRVSIHQYILYSISIIILGIIGYYGCLIVSTPLIKFLYPEFLQRSIRYVPITIAIAMIELYYSLLWPFVLRFGKTSYPTYISIIRAVVYILLAICLVQKFDVMAICYAGLFSSLIQAFVVFSLGFKIILKSGNEDL